jgi:hypothetical protein
MGATPDPTLLRGHVVILNVSDQVGRIVDEIQLGSRPGDPPIVILVQDEALWTSHPAWHPSPGGVRELRVELGCPAEAAALAWVRVADAAAAVILADPRQGEQADAYSTLVAFAVERLNPHVHTVIELLSSVNQVHLRNTLVNEVICRGDITEKLIAQSCISPGVGTILDRLVTASDDSCHLLSLPLPADLVGATYRELVRRSLERAVPYVVCGFVEPGDGRGRVVVNPRAGREPGKDSVLGPDHRLLVLAQGPPNRERAHNDE